MKTPKERYAIQAEFCKAMAHPVRLEVIDRLKLQDATVQSLARAIGVSQPNLSQHLAVLRAHGVVRANRHGAMVVYTLADPKIVDACSLIREILMEHAGRQRALIGS